MEGNNEPNFSLSKIYTDLHRDPEVRNYVNKKGGEKLSDKDIVIDKYLERFVNILNIDNQIEKTKKIDVVKRWLISRFTTKFEDISEGYWKLQQKILTERGQGADWEALDENTQNRLQKEHFNILRKDQILSLMEWVDYFTSEESNNINPRIKYWMMRNVLTMQDFDKEKHNFPQRSKGTIKMFPILDREILSKISETIQGEDSGEFGYDIDKSGKDQYYKLIKTRNFRELYGFLFDRQRPIPEELLKIIDGEWIKFEKGSNATELANTVRLRSTGWCTAGYATAQSQLNNGDFYLYLSRDLNNQLTVPRLAIRLESKHIAEVRGVAKNQNLDPYIGSVLNNKLKEFHDGEEYIKKEQDMRSLNEIYNKLIVDPETDLTKEEIIFLYELKRDIRGFGYQRDSRILACFGLRTPEIKHKKDDPLLTEIAYELIDEGLGDHVAEQARIFPPSIHSNLIDKLLAVAKAGSIAYGIMGFSVKRDMELAIRLIDAGGGYEVLHMIDYFQNVNYPSIKRKLIEKGIDPGLIKLNYKFNDSPKKVAESNVDLREEDLFSK